MNDYKINIQGSEIKSILSLKIPNTHKLLEKIESYIGDSLKYFDLNPDSPTYKQLREEYWHDEDKEEDPELPTILYVPFEEGLNPEFYRKHSKLKAVIAGPNVKNVPAGCFAFSSIVTFLGFNIENFKKLCFAYTTELEHVYNLYDLNYYIYSKDNENRDKIINVDMNKNPNGLRLAILGKDDTSPQHKYDEDSDIFLGSNYRDIIKTKYKDIITTDSDYYSKLYWDEFA